MQKQNSLNYVQLRQTDRQTDGRTISIHNVSAAFNGA